MYVGDPGSEVTVEDLIKGMIVLSGNDACIVVAEGIAGSEEGFADRMNKKAKELGMTGSVFKNASGWPAEGQMTTARDLALLAWHTINDFPQYYHFYSIQNWTYSNIKQDNRNLLLRQTPGVDGLKTGHTEEGGFGQTVSAVRDGRRLILVVNGLAMGKPQHEGGSERAQETARLMEWGFRESTNTTIFKAGDIVAEAPVWLGEQDKVPLVVAHAVQITTPTGTARDAARGRTLRRPAAGADHERRQARHCRGQPARRPRHRISARGRRRRAAPGDRRAGLHAGAPLPVRLAVVSDGPGRFITLEGGEGAGKSTQIARLKGWLESRGRPVVATREPGGSPGGEAIRKLLVEGSAERWDGTTEALLHFAARRDHLRATVWPALKKGAWVLSDRFADSTRAYQGYGHGLDLAMLDRLYEAAVGAFRPDLTLVLDLPVETGLARAAERRGSETRYESLPRDFHERVRKGFLEIAKREPKRCAVIDATKDIDTIAAAITRVVTDRLGS